MDRQFTVKDFFKLFPTDDKCLEHIMETRYGLQHDCHKCGKSATFHKIADRKSYACSQCGNHVYPCSGTLFQDSRTSLQLWFFAIYLFTTTRNGVSAKELQRQLGVTYKAAWRMGHEIRKHMANSGSGNLLSGIVEIDETMIGGRAIGLRGRAAQKHKGVVLGMVEKGGDLRTEVIQTVQHQHILQPILDNVQTGSTIHTDELNSYKTLRDRGYTHQTVNHGLGQYVSPEGVHTNTLESYWSMLKRGVAGTYIHVSKKHLEKYTKEFEYRFNYRKNPALMFPALLASFPKR